MGKSSETQVRGAPAITVSLWRSNLKQTAVPPTNIYTVPGTENAIKNETYEALISWRFHFMAGTSVAEGGICVEK